MAGLLPEGTKAMPEHTVHEISESASLSGNSSIRELALFFLRLGTTAFGGPAAHIAIIKDELVRRRHWLSREKFLDLLGASNLIPGRVQVNWRPVYQTWCSSAISCGLPSISKSGPLCIPVTPIGDPANFPEAGFWTARKRRRAQGLLPHCRRLGRYR